MTSKGPLRRKDERKQLDARYRRFDVAGLQRVACQAIGANRCNSLEKVGEGNYNKAYRLAMENGQRVIAKIPHPNAGPPAFTTASEVATMEFASTILSIPMPKVLAWSATDQNPVDTEYIIMEEAKGSPLQEVWHDLQLRTKRDIIHEIIDVERKLLSVSFDRVGSLYFNDCSVPDCAPMLATAGSQELCDTIQSRFCIGPIVRREFWEKERSEMRQHHGNTSREYLESVARREIDWMKAYADPQKAADNPWQYKSAEQHSPEAHILSLHKFLSAIPHIIPKDANIVSPRVWHPDFHAAWTTPVFLGANPPLLLDYGIDMLMKLPDNFKNLDEVTKDQLRYQVSQSILIHAYETLTAEKNPLMNTMMRYPHSQTLKQLEAFAGSSWDNCLFPLQECLIRVEKEWDHFDSTEPCPFHYSSEEIREHRKEADVLNDNQALWGELRGILTDEGYTSNETFGRATELLEKLRETGLDRLKGDERNEFDREKRVVLDPSAPA
ncbi:hypothetical protein EV356DRAFT_523458 [Viridothelium virens]|uniref:Altered inheritance of mitochondria protein 9, mitochondrial n=1 Tax=Viridothelium virens TaxID=1048519 RepID=A0A6A6HAM1_VIRVR|nr:hypothetical protein EV356DRAFT_523458 [Viridothelium virens]